MMFAHSENVYVFRALYLAVKGTTQLLIRWNRSHHIIMRISLWNWREIGTLATLHSPFEASTKPDLFAPRKMHPIKLAPTLSTTINYYIILTLKRRSGFTIGTDKGGCANVRKVVVKYLESKKLTNWRKADAHK